MTLPEPIHIGTLKGIIFDAIRGTNSKGHLRPGWMLRIVRPNGEYTIFTGFASPEQVAEYALTFGPISKQPKEAVRAAA